MSLLYYTSHFHFRVRAASASSRVPDSKMHIGGSLAASSSVGHAPSHTEAAHSGRTHRNDSGRGRLLRDTLYTGKCDVKVSVAVASSLLLMTGSERFIYSSILGR